MHFAGFDRRDFGMLMNLFSMSLSDRFLGSGLGLAWAVLGPLSLMGIFVFVFTFVFPGRLPNQDGALPFVIWLISGYAPWLCFSEGLSSATGSVVGNAGIVKNVAFKSELLPIVGAMLGLVPLAVGVAIVFILLLISGVGVSPALLFLPIALVLQLVFVSGLGMFLGALNVFVRDTALALPSVLTLVLFASPIFYPLTAYPEWARAALSFNPFYVVAEFYRAPLIHGSLPPFWMVSYLAIVACGTFAAGVWWFRRLKTFFDTRL